VEPSIHYLIETVLDIIIPLWGGELATEIVDKIDYQ